MVASREIHAPRSAGPLNRVAITRGRNSTTEGYQGGRLSPIDKFVASAASYGRRRPRPALTYEAFLDEAFLDEAFLDEAFLVEARADRGLRFSRREWIASWGRFTTMGVAP
jgi:hypothetical protein